MNHHQSSPGFWETSSESVLITTNQSGPFFPISPWKTGEKVFTLANMSVTGLQIVRYTVFTIISRTIINYRKLKQKFLQKMPFGFLLIEHMIRVSGYFLFGIATEM